MGSGVGLCPCGVEIGRIWNIAGLFCRSCTWEKQPWWLDERHIHRHSSKDAEVATDIRLWLRSKGHSSVFLDFDPEDGIPAGRNWEQELYQQLRSCRAVIAVCSEHSMASKWCFAEITQARSLGKSLIPVRIDGCVIGGVIGDHQFVDMTIDKAEAYKRLWNGLFAAGADPAGIFDWDPSRPPYPGLLSFQEKDAAVFFGAMTRSVPASIH